MAAEEKLLLQVLAWSCCDREIKPLRKNINVFKSVSNSFKCVCGLKGKAELAYLVMSQKGLQEQKEMQVCKLFS